jgi:hypothetical protein
MKKPLRLLFVMSFLSLLAAAAVHAGQTVTYSPFRPDPGDNLSRAENIGRLNSGYTTMDVIPGGIFSTLSDCSILFEGPASAHYAVRVPMLSFLNVPGMVDRICGFDYTIVEQVIIDGSKQTVMCRTNPNPNPSGTVNIRYTFMDLCPPS